MTDGIDLQKLHEEELGALTRFEERWEHYNPQPRQPRSFSIRDLGVEFPLTVVTGIAAIVQAAFRTGFKFFDLAAKSGMGYLSWADGASAMIGVEGFIAVIGFGRARAHGKQLIEEGVTKFSTIREWIGLVIALMISMMAGFAQSISGVKYIDPAVQSFVDWSLAVVLGVGASLLAYFAGDLAGLMIVRAELLYVTRMNFYRDALATWTENMKTAWEKSDEINYLHVDLKGETKVGRSFYQTPVRSTRSVRTNERTNTERTDGSDVAKKILAYLDEKSTDEFVPGPSEVSRELSVSKGYASAVIKQWRTAHNRPPETHVAALA